MGLIVNRRTGVPRVQWEKNGLVQDSGDNFSVTNRTGLFFSSGEIASGDKIMVRHIY